MSSSANPIATIRVDSRLSVHNPNSDYNHYLRQQQQKQEEEEEEEEEEDTPESPSSPTTPTSPTTNISNHAPVRRPPPRQPAHRSKLSMQYTPSESEDSDEEPLGLPKPVIRRSRFLSGESVQLNKSSMATESLRAISRLDMNQTAETSGNSDNISLDPAPKKMSLAKRISHIFGGSKNSKKRPTSPSVDTLNISDISLNDGQPQLLTPKSSMGKVGDNGNAQNQKLQPPMSVSYQRSWSSPDTHNPSSSNNSSSDALNSMVTNATTANNNRRSIILENRDRKARDSGFEETVGGQGHRRYSSASSTTPTIRPSPGNLNERPRSVYIEQHQQRAPNSPSLYPSGNSSENIRSATPQLGSTAVLTDEQYRSRRSTLVEPSMRELSQHAINTAAGGGVRRSSAPVISETLVSKIDREKSTVCFQSPAPKRDSYSREANLDPALSNLVQQHRRDYQVNTRLGGTGILPQQQDVHGMVPRRDSDVSNKSNSPHHLPVNTGSNSTSAIHTLEQNNKRMSYIHNQPPLVNVAGNRTSYAGSNSNLLNAAAASSERQQQQQQETSHRNSVQFSQQPINQSGASSSSQGRHRHSPKRQSSTPQFNLPQQQQQQQQYVYIQPTRSTNNSPVPSPVLGATTFGYGHDLSVAMQHQQQQQQHVQVQIQQHQLQQLQQQQQQQQQVYQAISPLTLLQHPTQQQQQQQLQQQQQQQLQQQLVQQQQSQQQLEQLQQFRIQQQVLMQQQQQLQQQLEQSRAAVTAAASATPQQQPIHFALPAAPVLTTAMGVGMGMGVNPSNMNMNMMSGYGQATMTPMMTSQGVYPRLIMTPQLTPQLMAYQTTPIYAYQPQHL
ncbi:hypothetical protein BGZ46_000815, partial [Entomortierella lignicola]